MAAFSPFKHLWVPAVFIFFFLYFKSIDALSNSSFSLSGFGGDPEFELNVALYGDAKVVGGGDALRLTGPGSSSAGRVMYKKPIRLVGGKPRRLISFSTDFSFSMSPNNGDGLGFLVVPNGLNVSAFDNTPLGLYLGSEKQKLNVLVVKFKAFSDAKNGNLIRTRLGIDVGSIASADLSNDSNTNWALIRGQKLHAWIDYALGSRRLEVRLAQNGDLRPSAPLLSYPIDFSQVWQNEEVLVGLSSSNGNSSQTCLVYSWSFKLMSIPNRMHSEPLDPKAIAIAKNSEPLAVKQEDKNCFMKVVAAMIFGTGCGALTAFFALYLWTIFGNRRPVVPEEIAAQQMDVKYKKVVVVLGKAIEDGKKVEV